MFISRSLSGSYVPNLSIPSLEPHLTSQRVMAQQVENTNNDHLVQSSDPEHPSNLIPELCRKFYNWGWVTGTGGGVGDQSYRLLRWSMETDPM